MLKGRLGGGCLTYLVRNNNHKNTDVQYIEAIVIQSQYTDIYVYTNTNTNMCAFLYLIIQRIRK